MTVSPVRPAPRPHAPETGVEEPRGRRPPARGPHVGCERSEVDCAVSGKCTLDSEDFKITETSSFVIFILIILYVEIIVWIY